jgi:hypothetical protein
MSGASNANIFTGLKRQANLAASIRTIAEPTGPPANKARYDQVPLGLVGLPCKHLMHDAAVAIQDRYFPREKSVGATTEWLWQEDEWNLEPIGSFMCNVTGLRRVFIGEGDNSHRDGQVGQDFGAWNLRDTNRKFRSFDNIAKWRFAVLCCELTEYILFLIQLAEYLSSGMDN